MLQHMTALLAKGGGDIRDEIFQEGGLHTGVALGADFLLVRQNGHGGIGGAVGLQNGGQGGISADTIVVAVAPDHAAVEAQIPGLEGGNRLQLGGEEIRLHHAVFFVEQLEDVQLHQLAALVVLEGAGAHQDIQILPLDHLGGGALHLFGAQMGQQVGDAEYRVAFLLAYADLHPGAILPDDNAVQSQRHGGPLVFLDPAVIMGVQIS